MLIHFHQINLIKVTHEIRGRERERVKHTTIDMCTYVFGSWEIKLYYIAKALLPSPLPHALAIKSIVQIALMYITRNCAQTESLWALQIPKIIAITGTFSITQKTNFCDYIPHRLSSLPWQLLNSDSVNVTLRRHTKELILSCQVEGNYINTDILQIPSSVIRAAILIESNGPVE